LADHLPDDIRGAGQKTRSESMKCCTDSGERHDERVAAVI
jgi:hypothetical protein